MSKEPIDETNLLDEPAILRVLFHPRRDYGPGPAPGVHKVEIKAKDGTLLGGRLHPAAPQAPAILYFHGNGEIAADYDDLAPWYTQRGITLLISDYRGYGNSGGRPTGRHLLSDAVTMFNATGQIMAHNGLTPARLYVMGRSLGSAAAIEVALHAGQQLAGLIIESGFADTFALILRLGLQVESTTEKVDGFGNAIKLGQITTRALFIHGQDDVLIPAFEGEKLYQQCAAQDKQLVLIPHAGHNDLMLVGMEQYFDAIQRFVT
jgi:hypothetical protein